MGDVPQFPATFQGLLSLTAHLRGPEGCPWDREQTPDSLKRYILEECYELVEAIETNDPTKIAEELGDVSLHLALQVQIGKEEGAFDEEQVFQGVIEKLTRRHPHVFGDTEVSDTREVESRWEDIKRAERGRSGASMLEGVPKTMPALSYAQSLQERAARSGFDWEDVQGAVAKVGEELNELQSAESPAERELELGDVLFSIVNVSRWMDIDSEKALRAAADRFRARFSHMEDRSKDRGATFDGLSMNEKEELWREAKRAP